MSMTSKCPASTTIDCKLGDALKALSVAAINALKEALTAIYWYKRELRFFLTQTVDDTGLLSQLNWDDYKRNVVSSLVEHLAKNQARHKDTLLKLIREVCQVQDFTHLLKEEDGKTKAKIAEDAVKALLKIAGTHVDVFKDQEAVEGRRKDAKRKMQRVHGV